MRNLSNDAATSRGPVDILLAAFWRFFTGVSMSLVVAGSAPRAAIAQPSAPVAALTPADGRPCPPLAQGYGDEPGLDVVKALNAYSGLEDSLQTYHVQDRVIGVAIDLSKSSAALDLIADNTADVPLIQSSVPKKFDDVPTEVTERTPYDRFLPYMLKVRGLRRAANPPAGCPQPNEEQRPDLDATRAMAARIDLLADLSPDLVHLGSNGAVLGIGVNLEGKVSALDVTVKNASDVQRIRALVPENFEGVPTVVTVVGQSEAE
jgi:hypothetical protein